MIRDLHSKPFDEGTLKKLEIFELYTVEWLPTFIMSGAEHIWIFDFFAGTGYDLNHTPGSPIRILRQIKKQLGNMYQKNTKMYLVFNEYDKIKFKQLKEACDNLVETDSELKRAKANQILNYSIFQEDFAVLFPQFIKQINLYPSLVFLDQNGVKFLADEYFTPLINSHSTDYLYFVSSSYVRRFGETLEFSKSISCDLKRAEKEPATWIHRNILEQLRKRIPQGNKTKLYPFSIKKNINVYGIIFGASHPRAVDKFLATAWKENSINGEANFDIDDDKNKSQLCLLQGGEDLSQTDDWVEETVACIRKEFPDCAITLSLGEKPLTKIEKFQQSLRENIISKKLLTNKDVYDYTLEQGHIPIHATEEMKRMRNEGLITYSRSPKVNYEQVYKNNNIVTYQ